MNLHQGAEAWVGAEVLGAPPARGQVQQREEGQESFGFPLGMLNIMLNTSDRILLCKHMSGTGLDTCLTQGWDNSDKGRDVTVVPGRENSISFEVWPFPWAQEHSMGPALPCCSGSTDPLAVQGRTGCSGQRRVVGPLSSSS